MNNILLVGAHYDDIELGVGGTAARLAAEGKQVYKLILTDNFVKESVFNKYTDPQVSKKDSQKACDILGIKEITRLEKVQNCHLRYSTELMQQIEKLIVQYQIDTVFMHSEYDMNMDHVEAAKICKVAARHVDNLYIYRSNIYITETQFIPKIFFDISDYIEQKKKALAAYGDEHQRSMAGGQNKLFENVIYQNKIWGYAVDKMYAEGFEVIKETR